MRVALLSAGDLGGGAAIAATRLFRGLEESSERNGMQVRMYVAAKRGADLGILPIAARVDAIARLRRAVLRAQIEWNRHRRDASGQPEPDGAEVFSDDRSALGNAATRAVAGADVVHLHWVAGLIDFRRFFAARPARVVWTLHDENPFTGGCHYDDGCDRFMGACGKCPQLGSLAEVDPSLLSLERKRGALANGAVDALVLVSPSRWLAERARSSALFARFRVEHIENGIDVRAFAPRDRASARYALGLPHDQRLVLFVGSAGARTRKGFHVLVDAMQGLRGARLVVAGRGGGPAAIELGWCDDDPALAAAYAAADVVVIPSLHDNLPNVLLEAFACGRCVVASAVGGMSDHVLDGENGLLVRPNDAADLHRAIERAIADLPLRERIEGAARAYAMRALSLDRQVDRVTALYRELLGARSR